MNPQTTFRKTLVNELTALAGAHELDQHFVQMKYIEEKRDVLGEFLDYYTDDVLDYKPFADEFNQVEIEKLRRFISFLHDVRQGTRTWPDARTEAASLLEHLAG
ncbi:MAG: hypothetical protein M3O30_19405 [Planctomycetota bacterium]|nr:hypothetical protein [Planctomycetota bacterium]